MKAIWVDAGNDADYMKLRARGITDPYFDVRDPRITKPYLEKLRSDGFSPGVYAAWNWQNWKTGAEFANWMHGKLRPLPQYPDFPKVHLDIETHDVQWIIDALTRFRTLRPKRVTGFTLEGHQGGLFTPQDAAAITKLDMDILPQAYRGDMIRQESDRVVMDLIAAGFDPKRIYCFHDAAQVGDWWEGVLFTQGRLP